jgi:hypothetical protein
MRERFINLMYRTIHKSGLGEDMAEDREQKDKS